MTAVGCWKQQQPKQKTIILQKKFRHGQLQADHLWTSAKAIMAGPHARTMTALGWLMAATADKTK
jgi:hypothetical protein